MHGIPADIAERLRELARGDARTQRDIAKASSIPEAAFSRFMQGKMGMSFDTAVTLATVLGAELRVKLITPRRRPK